MRRATKKKFAKLLGGYGKSRKERGTGGFGTTRPSAARLGQGRNSTMARKKAFNAINGLLCEFLISTRTNMRGLGLQTPCIHSPARAPMEEGSCGPGLMDD